MAARWLQITLIRLAVADHKGVAQRSNEPSLVVYPGTHQLASWLHSLSYVRNVCTTAAISGNRAGRETSDCTSTPARSIRKPTGSLLHHGNRHALHEPHRPEVRLAKETLVGPHFDDTQKSTSGTMQIPPNWRELHHGRRRVTPSHKITTELSANAVPGSPTSSSVQSECARRVLYSRSGR